MNNYDLHSILERQQRGLSLELGDEILTSKELESTSTSTSVL